MKHFAILVVLVAACKTTEVMDSARVQAMAVKPPHDTTRFAVPASAKRCHDGRSVLIEAVSEQGSGMLVRLRYKDSLTSGSYPIVWPDDTASSPGATVAVRYVVRDVASSFALDSGVVQVQRKGDAISGEIVGRGVENAVRMFTSADLHDVPLRADTVSCRYQP